MSDVHRPGVVTRKEFEELKQDVREAKQAINDLADVMEAEQ